MTIALDARIRRAAGAMRIDVRVHYMCREVVGEVEHQVVDAQLLGYTTGIVHIADRTATGVALASPQTHGDTHDFVTLTAKFCGGNGRVDASRHRNENLHARKGYCLVRNRSTQCTMASAAYVTSSCVVL